MDRLPAISGWERVIRRLRRSDHLPVVFLVMVALFFFVVPDHALVLETLAAEVQQQATVKA